MSLEGGWQDACWENGVNLLTLPDRCVSLGEVSLCVQCCRHVVSPSALMCVYVHSICARQPRAFRSQGVPSFFTLVTGSFMQVIIDLAVSGEGQAAPQ